MTRPLCVLFAVLAALPLGIWPANAVQRDIKIGGIDFLFASTASLRPGYDALLIANSQYAHVQSLQTPDADVKLIQASLAPRGVRAQALFNPDIAQLQDALTGFSQSANKDLFIFYYSGHAGTISNKNAMLFKDFSLDDIEENKTFIDIESVISKIASMGYKKVLIIFDACRNTLEDRPTAQADAAPQPNPSTAGIRGLSVASIDTRSLKTEEYAISFSASQGEFAIDSLDGRNSPYAETLADNLSKTDSLLTAVMTSRRAVKERTEGKQNPTLEVSWDSDVTLANNPLRSISIDFFDSKTIRADDSKVSLSEKRNWDNMPSLEITVPADELQACTHYNVTETNVRNVSFQVDALYQCALRKVGADVTKYREMNDAEFFDDVVYAYDSITVDADFNLNGAPETIELHTAKDGGYVDFSQSGSLKKSFRSTLGGNVDEMYVSDFNGDGVADYAFLFETRDPTDRTDEPVLPMQAIAVLDGTKVRNLPEGAYDCPQAPLAKPCQPFLNFGRYFQSKDKYHIKGLSYIAMYYDEAIRTLDRVGQRSIEYTAFRPTYELDQPTDERQDKKVIFDRNGGIKITVGGAAAGAVYDVSPFGGGEVRSVREGGSVATPPPPAGPQEAAGGAPAAPDVAKEAAAAFYRSLSLPVPAARTYLEGIYAPEVGYFGQQRLKAAVIADKLAFMTRWPDRSYAVDPASASSKCDSAGNCEVSGIVQWRTHSVERKTTSAGTARFKLVFATGGSLTLVSEWSEVVNRSVSREK